MARDTTRRSTHRYVLADDERPSRGVYMAVAETRGCSPLDLRPLAEAIDPDAVDGLLLADEGPDAVAFEYSGYEVRVTVEAVCVSAGDG